MKALSICILALLLVSCARKNQIEGNPAASTMDGSVFSGILPCIDCKGIAVVIKLKGGNFEIETEHPDSSGEINRSKGTYEIKRNTLFLLHADSLDIPLVYSINESSLTPLALKNKQDGNYMLKKITNQLQEITWIPVELNGKKMIIDTTAQRMPHLIFKILTNSVTGNGGCNSFSGRYELKANSIRISRLISTKMACERIQFESIFMMALGDCDNFKVRNDTLLLNKGEFNLLKLYHKL
ncbi:MAG TPA: META domain-containing protein [Bacteroidales bacterium]|nr:META domain-containing protein [Bacteroidales bacterium]